MGIQKIDYNQLPEGEDFPVSVDLRGFVPRTGASGHAPEGNYLLEITRWRNEPKRGAGKSGRNLHLEAKVVEPEAQKGVPIHAYMPAPTTYDESDAGYGQTRGLIWSNLSVEGKLEQAQKLEVITLSTASKLRGKRFCARLADNEYEGRTSSQIARYLSVEEFRASPGPDRAMPASTTQTPPAQTSEPELFTGDSGKRGQAAVADSVLFQ